MAKLPDMGRPKSSANRDLPPRMTRRTLKGGRVLYYYRTRTGGAIALGADLAEAKLKWADLEQRGVVAPRSGWLAVSARYRREGLAGKAVKTQHEYAAGLDRLDAAFGKATLEQIKPAHIREYLDRRTAKIAGNREIALLSAVFNWARERGITDAPNPCAGVRKHHEAGRDIYVTDEQYQALWDAATPELQDALDLARLTGQRPADVRKMRRDDIRDGHLWVRQGKTGARVGIAITGELATVVDRILRRPRTATGPWLVQTDKGQPLTHTMLRTRFDDARETSGQKWQFRDLRSKAATDVDDVRRAQELLGHSTEATTAGIYRRRRGNKVAPVR
ncbi:tyrosine-type recombinase/integrase [Pseudazoarcus pumilus]|nr:tyrosine-type recombinase/integrase [Pseudazoarcus pumilus]